jgi:hypothetical protein
VKEVDLPRILSACRPRLPGSLLALLALVAIAASGAAQQPSRDSRVSDIARAGKIRAGLHLPQFVQDPATGEIKGQGTAAPA